MTKRTLVTSALPYANGPIHLGHLAGAYLPADLFVRYKRLLGEDIIFICGSDEHGVPITIAAEKEGVQPQDIVDRYHNMNKAIFEKAGISFDYYGRTSSPVHHQVSSDIFTTLNNKGVFKKKTEKQLFDAEAGKFLADRYIKGTCPKCGNPDAYGDQCEKCGTSLSPSELINPKSMLTGSEPVYRETEHWYLPLGDLQNDIERWLDTRKNWKNNVMGQCKSWLKGGLTDRAVTRDLTWGVPVPLEEAKGKVLYVWFDAPIGYISATKEWAELQGRPDLWKSYWQDSESRLLHFIGKDNIVFHCIMFPAMLMKHGDYILPDNVPANEFLNLEGRKLSTSRGWAVWLHEYLDEFDADNLRYVLGTILPENKDSDFSWKDYQQRVNSELADILGNFVFRTLSFTDRFFGGKVPELVDPTKEDLTALNEIDLHKKLISEAYEDFRFRDAISLTMNLARTGNKYLTESEPWKTRKTDEVRAGNSIHVCLQIVSALSILFDPILPTKMSQLRNQIGIKVVNWSDVNQTMLSTGTEIHPGEILFVKIEDEVIEKQIQKLHQSDTTNNSVAKYEPIAAEIEFDQFISNDLRTGVILSAENIPKSKKLLKLQVDIGFEHRQILSGIAEFFKPEDIIGKKIVIVANLKERMMMGMPSQGMILMANNPDGSLSFISSDGEPGSRIS
ncbi:MAG TPA: methionine--tRNA ligase [Bacteroidetes bacterium]|nr:methionine--tRNA ligase [Bacteroidota bacterium]